MEKEFTPYEQALALKELGFNEPCYTIYNRKEQLHPFAKSSVVNNVLKVENDNEFTLIAKCLAPTFSQAFRFFREKYGLHHKIDFTVSRGYTYNEAHFFFIKKTIGSTSVEVYDNSFNSKEYTYEEWNKKCKGSYEEAELECLKKLIEIVKKK